MQQMREAFPWTSRRRDICCAIEMPSTEKELAP